MSKTNNINTCPFCGSERCNPVAMPGIEAVRWSVVCLGCEASGPKAFTSGLAIELWNSEPF